MSVEQRIEGSLLIEAEVKRAYLENNKVVESIFWEPEIIANVIGSNIYNLHVQSNGKTATLKKIPRESIEDYPGRVGNEVLNAYIKELAAK
jgi:hypothetical protein